MYTISRRLALAAVLGSMTIAGSAYAAPVDTSAPMGPPNSAINIDQNGNTSYTPDTSNGMILQQGHTAGSTAVAPMQQPRHMARPASAPTASTAPAPSAPAPASHHMMSHSPADMQQHVEERIKVLHEKLQITSGQEAEWNDVAQAMRDSESEVSAQIQQREENKGSMTAVDDMESYEKIAQAHADGLSKVIAPFKTLYGDMSDAQKKNADQVFGSYEGRMGHHHAGHKGHKPATK